MSAPIEHRCFKCGGSAPFGFGGAPTGRPEQWACAVHAVALRAAEDEAAAARAEKLQQAMTPPQGKLL